MLWRIPFKADGDGLNYKRYNLLEQQIRGFNGTHSVIGQDESNGYNLYTFKLGNPNKPKIYLMAGMHGTEWHGSIITMKFLTQIRDGTYPDKTLLYQLLNEYCIVCLPVLNPWGYDRQTRYNINDSEFNRDYNVWSQSEVRAMRDSFISEKPFAFLDFHLMQPNYTQYDVVVSHGHPKTAYLAEYTKRSFTAKTGEPVTRWINSNDPHKSGNSRFWAVGNDSPNTSCIVSSTYEITRYDKYTNKEIMEYGLYLLHLFCTSAINYHKKVSIGNFG
ncbi:succinylglutamate desuccinylase/aspartoacylase family protein [Salipaludibacillus agaradhaerens]|jgi:predicted deacylase|uniref:Succinylglutamate desuccinylase/aspartoacylase family protein n=1 Tax=Salipaludibacillus agaradhaerens TaxID=76935 RepID=A0A9Q4FY04_SALAG|nr:M14 family zinc carboxypeptidase [Salipaludibacillus agaradhaerens]MCR6095223.1 succinylglutamate desuccinylase/aspartoacylase family protein [Salipaludibacillus agaradhaerens]MCR6115219.1 succinylglutamate desuccinylase/aspartoacylase family protein [Salipaludibacillus agaradhaerens]